MIDIRQSENYADYMERLGWGVDTVDSVYVFSKKIPLLGSVIKIQRGEHKISKYNFQGLVKKRRAFMVLIEAKNDEHQDYYLKQFNFRKTRSSSLPSKTIQIDLTKNLKLLLRQMHYKTRYNTKVAKKKGVLIERSGDIKRFAKFWQKSARKRGMFLSLQKEIEAIYRAFGDNALLLFAEKEKELLGGVMVLFAGSISYYMYAASSKEGNKLFAPTLLVWEAIKYSKKKKRKTFDFEGVYDARFPIDSWKGFSRFKRSFGGKAVEHPGSLRKFYIPW
jgi:lipid II:glycine glycyltransferase (peptidoglycan interpeptide bridge formation enzyme)